MLSESKYEYYSGDAWHYKGIIGTQPNVQNFVLKFVDFVTNYPMTGTNSHALPHFKRIFLVSAVL